MGLTQKAHEVPVGLGILVAMETSRSTSEPITIVSRETSAFKLVEMEGYSSVHVSHVGEASSRKRAHLEGGATFCGQTGEEEVVAFFLSPVTVVEAPPPLLPTEGFLRHCSLCGKSLHGNNIFMYRGERPFCSTDCRFEHMMDEERREKYYGSKLVKAFYEYHSNPPCSTSVHLPTGVAAA